LGLILRGRRELDSALSSYLEVEKLNPSYDIALSEIAKIYFEKREFKKAKEYVEKALKLNPENNNALILRPALKGVR